jgi:ribose/xylose/arabinose/galactoside ABC-type transport system permease subunit
MRSGHDGEHGAATGRRGGHLGDIGPLAYRWRIYVLAVGIFAVMTAIAPNFMTGGNFANILKAAGINVLAAAGFTIVMISGQLDLSIGSAMTLGGMMAVGLQPQLGWAGSCAVALLCGLAVGLANGILVAKARINSFIVTLGTMIILQNIVFIYCRGETISATSFDLWDWFQYPLFSSLPAGWLRETLGPSLTPRILLPYAVMAALAVLVRWTPTGRAFYLLGGNPQTAWYSGLRVDRLLIGAFVLSGVLSALGGAVIAMSEANANPTLGDNSLMTIVAAVIIGGTSMQGGKGSLLGTAVALVALAALVNGLSCRGEGYEVQLMASGLVLALIIVYDAWSEYRRAKRRGQRKDLLKELRAAAGD